MTSLSELIEQAWQTGVIDVDGEKAINEVLYQLDNGLMRVAAKEHGAWTVNQMAKKAVLLYFKLRGNEQIELGPFKYFDKVPLKFSDDTKMHELGSRVLPGAIVRHGSYIGKQVVLMPSFVNIGAYVDDGCMIDSWATIGSCAQIGKNCHISGGVGIGGVLEPLQAEPVIIEDGCFIGARSEIAEGVHVGKGAVISMGVYLGASTKIINRDTGEIHHGHVPPYSVVVPGTLPATKAGAPSLYCAVIVKQVDERTRSKTAINDLLRETE